MPGFVTNPPFGVQDPTGVRASSTVSLNTRVRGTNGMIAIQSDVLIFPGPASTSGLWTIPNTRVSISGVRVIESVSQGLALTTNLPTTVGPLLVAESDRRITRP